MSEVGRGQKTYDFGRARGRWVRLEGPDDVLIELVQPVA